MLKAAIEKIQELVKPTTYTDQLGNDYVIAKNGGYEQIRSIIDKPSAINLHSLDAIIKFVRTEAIKEETVLYITIPSHTEVQCFGRMDSENRYIRNAYYYAQATDVPGWKDVMTLPFEQASVALQTRFQESVDRAYALQLLSQITTGAKVTYNDIGVATNVVTARGVALQENSVIRPLVKLRPYRTFQEIEQPEGLFLIRIDERGITFTEADGGMWKLTARRTIAKHLEDNLEDLVESGKVVIAL